MKKISLIPILIILLFSSCYLQQEIDVVRLQESEAMRARQKKTEQFATRKQTLKENPSSKNRKLRDHHQYFYQDNNGKWHFIPNPKESEFIHYKRTSRLNGSNGKVRVIKRAAVARPIKY